MNSRVKLINFEEGNYIELKKVETLNNNNLLLNINSNFNLKLLFSYLKYDKILKLIKYNKSLQNKIEIEENNYKEYSNIEINSEAIKNKIGSGKIKINTLFLIFFLGNCNINDGVCSPLGFSFLFFFLYFLFPIIAITFYTSYVFSVQRKLNIVWVTLINKSLFLLILSRFMYLFIILINSRNDAINVYLILSFFFIHILYEVLIFIKYINLYIIKKDDLMDLIFLLFNFAIIVKYFVLIFSNWPKTFYYLVRYKKLSVEPHCIKIENYRKNKKKYISNRVKELKYKYLDQDLKVFNKINIFRKKNNLTELKLKDNIPDFIINEISEVILFKEQHLFKLPNNKYLLKYEFGQFNYYFQNNNKNLIDILLKEGLNMINIVTQRNMQYILLYEDEIDIEF